VAVSKDDCVSDLLNVVHECLRCPVLGLILSAENAEKGFPFCSGNDNSSLPGHDELYSAP
jgi:hypothetical protein